MGSGTTHVSAVIKATPMYRSWKNMFVKLTTEEIENTTKEILSMLHSSVELKSLPGNCEITQQNPVLIYRNFTNIFFHDLYIGVAFMTAET
jgi:hypothetical protein